MNERIPFRRRISKFAARKGFLTFDGNRISDQNSNEFVL